MNSRGRFDAKAVYALLVLAGIIGIVFYWRVGVEDIPGDYNVKKGNYRLEDGLFEQAVSEFSQALDKNPDHVQAHLGLAITYMQMNRLDDARAEFDKTIALAPDLAAAYANLGILYDRTGKYQLALDNYRKALALDPEILEGPGWLWRFMHNVEERPPTVADRIVYLEAELKKPPEERVLRIQEQDKQQRMYKVDD
ncbi:MAG: tetratricopeptide repeat protein [Desulfobacterales bacterium]|nr:tetratricopeptide repeat protein [Desulfobacterales bacterium]